MRRKPKEENRVPVWPDMADGVAVFFHMGTQWNLVGVGLAGILRVGLRYEVIDRMAQAISVPHPVTGQTFADIQTLEAAALAAWSK